MAETRTTTATGKDLGAFRAAQAEDPALFGIAGLSGVLRAILPFVVAVGAWWAIWAALDPPEIVLVSPASVFGSFIDSIREGVLPTFIARSLGRLGIGTLAAAAVGIPLGWLLGLDEDVATTAEPIMRFFNAVSGIAWLPAMIIWFGFTETTIQAVIVYTMIFPVAFNAMIGVRTIPRRYRDACRTLGASRLRIVRDVYMPGSFPGVMTGMRLGIGFGWRALIAGEFVVGTAAGGGLGFFIFDARTQGVIGKVMAGMIVLGLLAMLTDRLILRPIEETINVRWGAVKA